MSMQPIELTPSDFDDKNPQKLHNKYKDTVMIVKFYSPGCIYCIQSQPEYVELANRLKDDPKYKVAQFDCTKSENMTLLNDKNKFMYGYNIEGYPTYIIFVNTLFKDYYTGERTANSMINALTFNGTLN